jgi:transcriptional regulator
MRSNPDYASDDAQLVREMVHENPWALLISATSHGVIASHCPILLDEGAPELTILTHFGRPDDQLHELGERELLVIVQGNHGYVSPSWYAPGATRAPTWNFSTAHCYGVPELLGEQENLRVLSRLVERFERNVERPLLLDPDYGARIARGTAGVRVPVTRFVCKRKLSQDKDPVSQRQVIEELRSPGAYHQPSLAQDMERALRVHPPSF